MLHPKDAVDFGQIEEVKRPFYFQFNALKYEALCLVMLCIDLPALSGYCIGICSHQLL